MSQRDKKKRMYVDIALGHIVQKSKFVYKFETI